jgi:hypothetical protein
MGIMTLVRRVVKSAARRYGYEIVARNGLYDWQLSGWSRPRSDGSPLPDGAVAYLRGDSARLRELEARYAMFDPAVTAPRVWTDRYVRPEDILYFRGENAYVCQLRGDNMNALGYALTTYYVKSIDTLGLLDRLSEDNLFGSVTFEVTHRVVSRDLLDSIVEIYFLDKHLRLSAGSGWTVLDIGAGYGRLAHRMAEALPGLGRYLCTDAVAVSTFISEYYLRFRGVEARTRVIALDEVENTLADGAVDVALNIHSFSECRLSAVEWWLGVLKRRRVRHLMLVPNIGPHGGQRLVAGDRQDFSGVLERHGYQLVAKEPKYRDPVVQKYGINPTYHYLFELR